VNLSANGTDRFTATNTSLELLIEIAFGVDDTRISAGRWRGQERYDVTAKAEDGVRLPRANSSHGFSSCLHSASDLHTIARQRTCQGSRWLFRRAGRSFERVPEIQHRP
jgi:hypothetical protein